ncbi:hypothetical protein BD626DRAFT_478787 [Schizophyllum amplum]|uniref:Zn(2)-C6 fungal-type domain-containing protein n=1 Tax=Schizophyllum amplum TaxID=97359 RepID=A0A550CRL8_9AGAR|nr:hypothetical protein BD626DRAFT_478787 [Auriculariopsis ampla]
MESHSPEPASDGKKKKTACDYCKAKRVICHPQTDGKPCPRCVEKGVECTTTILPKRTRGKGKKTLAKEAAAAGLPLPLPSKKTESRPVSRAASSSTLTIHETPEPPPLIVPSTLMREALDIFVRFPPSQNPLFSVDTLRESLEQVKWDSTKLDPSRRVLAHCILAFSSLVSVDPYYIGCDERGAPFPDRLMPWDALNHNGKSSASAGSTLGGLDVAEIGRRRKVVSHRLHIEATRLAEREGIATNASAENAASCFLLDCIDSTDPSTYTMAWSAAFIWNFRTLAESGELEWQFAVTPLEAHIIRVQWRGSFLAIAMYALSIDKTLPFTVHDEELICGPSHVSFEDALARASSLPPEPAVTVLMNSLITRAIRLARDCLETISGAAARRRQFNEVAALRMISAVELFQSSANRLRAYLVSLGSGPNLRICLHANAHALGTLAVALHRALDARAAESGLLDAAAAQRLAAQRRVAKALAVRAVVKGSMDIRAAMSPYRLRFKQFTGLDAWAKVLIGDRSGAAGADERAEALVRLRDIIKFSTYAGVDMHSTVAAIDVELDVIRAGSGTQADDASWEGSNPWSGFSMDANANAVHQNANQTHSSNAGGMHANASGMNSGFMSRNANAMENSVGMDGGSRLPWEGNQGFNAGMDNLYAADPLMMEGLFNNMYMPNNGGSAGP